MAASDDLQTATGIHRRFFLRIDGHKDVLWQGGRHPNENPITVAARRGTSSLQDDPVPGPHELDSECVGLWRFDEVHASQNCADESYFQNIAVPGGTTTVGDGKFFKSRAFGAGDYINVTAADELECDSFTFSCWFYPNTGSPPTGSGIAHFDHPTNPQAWLIATNGTNNQLTFTVTDAAGNSQSTTSSTYSTQTWHHLACLYRKKDGLLYIYIDGELENGATKTGDTLPGYDRSHGANDVLHIGHNVNQWPNGYWDGNLCDVAYYNTSKSAEWIYRTYKGGNGFSRPGVRCLRPGQEFSQDLNIADAKSSWSAMTFELDNIRDPASRGEVYYFSKLFAPGRWQNSGKWTYTMRQDFDDEAIAAKMTGQAADEIYVVKNTDYTDNINTYSELHLGPETFRFETKSDTAQTNFTTNKTLGTLEKVTKGLYPAVDDPVDDASTTEFGRAFRHPYHRYDVDGAVGQAHIVSTVPYSWIGRRAALYVTTWDQDTGSWHGLSDSELVWCGLLSDSISYDPRTNGWQLTCESVLSELDRTICDDLAGCTLAPFINLKGSQASRRFYVMVQKIDDTAGTALSVDEIDIPAGLYDLWGLITTVEYYINAEGIRDGVKVYGSVVGEDGNKRVQFNGSIDAGLAGRIVTIVPMYGEGFDYNGKTIWADYYSHCLYALGITEPLVLNFADGEEGSTSKGDSAPFAGYQPVHPSHSGNLMYLERTGRKPISTQGDHDTNIAFIASNKASPGGDNKGDERYLEAYSSVTDESTAYVHHTKLNGDTETTSISLTKLVTIGIATENQRLSAPSYVGYRFEDWSGNHEKVIMRNALRPAFYANGQQEGPFRMILRAILSTGDNAYNSTNDVYPHYMGLGIPAKIIDAASFIAADDEILASHPTLLSTLNQYLIDEATSISQLLSEFGKLYGYAVTWTSGRMTLKKLYSPNLEDTTITINESNSAMSDDQPTVSMSVDTVINQYKIKCGYNVFDRKFEQDVIINDVESQQGLIVNKTVDIEAKSLLTSSTLKEDQLGELVHMAIQDRFYMLRQPWHVIERSLAPTLFNRIFVGDIVQVDHDFGHPDPFGGGGMTCDGYATVLGISWNLETMVGRCKLLIWSTFDRTELAPYAPSALVDHTATNAGFDTSTNALVLTEEEFGDQHTDSHDGEAFLAGAKVIVFERTSTNVDSASASAIYTIAAGGYDTGTNKLSLTTSPSGFDETGETEYFVTFCGYSNAVSNMYDDGSWLGDADTVDVDPTNTGAKPYRWG